MANTNKKDWKISKADRKQIIEQRMTNIAREAYSQELNLIMYKSYKEQAQVVAATQANVDKQKLAYAALETELAAVEALKE